MITKSIKDLAIAVGTQSSYDDMPERTIAEVVHYPFDNSPKPIPSWIIRPSALPIDISIDDAYVALPEGSVKFTILK